MSTVNVRTMPDMRTLPDLRRQALYPSSLLSQYVNSPRLVALLQGLEDLIDPVADVEAFRARVIDPLTAEGWGLDQWGKIVDIGRTFALQGDDGIFGFLGSGLQPFDQGTFAAAGRVDTGTYALADDAYRDLILLKAAANIADCSLPSLNRLIARLYGERGRAYVLEVGTMRIRYVFEFALQPWERALMGREDVPPKPAGVGYEIYEVAYPAFGFAGSGLHPFNQGTFIQGGPYDAYTV